MAVQASDTWGISSTGFLVLYVGACIVWGVAIELWWAHLRRAGDGRRRGEPGVYELAVLNEGPALAVAAAAASLCASGALSPGDRRGTVRASGALPVGAAPIEWELLDTVRRRPGITNRELRRTVARAPEARALTQRLVREGLLVNPHVSRWLWVTVLPLIGLGIARLGAGIENHKPVGFLTVLIVLLGFLAAHMWGYHHQPTRAGEQVLAARREREGNWKAAAVEVPPSLAVALFGASVLWTLEPGIASGWAPPATSSGGGFFTPGGGGGGGCGGGGGGCGG